MQQRDDEWSWSEAFKEILKRLMWEPQSAAMARWDWHSRRERLELWQGQVDAARELYREGHAEALRVLYDYWCTIADDVREQARFARESYHQVPFLWERLSPAKKTAGIVEGRSAESRHG
jgi:hypothetical protein